VTRPVLFAYSLAVTTALAGMLVGRTTSPNSSAFDQITVHRINVVEPNGTVRMIISDGAEFPGLIVHNKEKTYPRPYAGMLFYNNEGTENGGLVFAGHKDSKGEVVDSGGSLSFDKYGAPGQIVQVAGVDDIHDRFAGLLVNGISEGRVQHRVWAGRDAAGMASVALMDLQGRKRIIMQVSKDGAASLAFLDEQGKVVKQITP